MSYNFGWLATGFPRLLVIVFFFISIQSCTSGQVSQEEKKLNVLLILIDDLKPAIGAYGNEIAITPEMDKLAGESIRFTKAFANQAVCAPSRLNLMLGSRSTSSGIYDFGRDFREFYPDAITLPQYFQQHGYHAESMGKVYHIGHGTYNDEASWSIPHHADKVIEYNDLESTGGELTREEALFGNRTWEYARSLSRGAAWESPEVADTAYADGRVASYAIERLRALLENADQPFFMAVGFARPHMPFSVPQKYWDLYDPEQLPMPAIETAPKGAPLYAGKDGGGEIAQYKPVPTPQEIQGPFPDPLKRNLIHGYYASVSYVDTQIGKVLTELKNLGLNENTIVVLWGDHGFHLGELGIWTKHVNYEIANRIPLMIKAPGVTTPGSSTDQLAETVDIYPTLADLAGLPVPNPIQPLDGESLVPVLKNPESRVSDHAYHTYPRGRRIGRAIRTDQYRLVEWKEIGADPETADFELYDYSDGLVEKVNLASEKPEVVERLKRILYRYPEAHLARPPSPRRE
ncbi:sulfatase [Rhodohalobacter sp. 614A]|uniref:sulfatase n=1 Tax=Rhodohalobacter sp. 614A TaxID=2908649 RepID=UPI00351D1A62